MRTRSRRRPAAREGGFQRGNRHDARNRPGALDREHGRSIRAVCAGTDVGRFAAAARRPRADSANLDDRHQRGPVASALDLIQAEEDRQRGPRTAARRPGRRPSSPRKDGRAGRHSDQDPPSIIPRARTAIPGDDDEQRAAANTRARSPSSRSAAGARSPIRTPATAGTPPTLSPSRTCQGCRTRACTATAHASDDGIRGERVAVRPSRSPRRASHRTSNRNQSLLRPRAEQAAESPASVPIYASGSVRAHMLAIN